MGKHSIFYRRSLLFKDCCNRNIALNSHDLRSEYILVARLEALKHILSILRCRNHAELRSCFYLAEHILVIILYFESTIPDSFKSYDKFTLWAIKLRYDTHVRTNYIFSRCRDVLTVHASNSKDRRHSPRLRRYDRHLYPSPIGDMRQFFFRYLTLFARFNIITILILGNVDNDFLEMDFTFALVKQRHSVSIQFKGCGKRLIF